MDLVTSNLVEQVDFPDNPYLKNINRELIYILSMIIAISEEDGCFYMSRQTLAEKIKKSKYQAQNYLYALHHERFIERIGQRKTPRGRYSTTLYRPTEEGIEFLQTWLKNRKNRESMKTLGKSAARIINKANAAEKKNKQNTKTFCYIDEHMDFPDNPYLKNMSSEMTYLLGLINSHDEEGEEFFRSLKTLARKTKKTEWTVANYLRALIFEGLIKKIGQRKTRRGRFSTTVYKVTQKGKNYLEQKKIIEKSKEFLNNVAEKFKKGFQDLLAEDKYQPNTSKKPNLNQNPPSVDKNPTQALTSTLSPIITTSQSNEESNQKQKEEPMQQPQYPTLNQNHPNYQNYQSKQENPTQAPTSTLLSLKAPWEDFDDYDPIFDNQEKEQPKQEPKTYHNPTPSGKEYWQQINQEAKPKPSSIDWDKVNKHLEEQKQKREESRKTQKTSNQKIHQTLKEIRQNSKIRSKYKNLTEYEILEIFRKKGFLDDNYLPEVIKARKEKREQK